MEEYKTVLTMLKIFIYAIPIIFSLGGLHAYFYSKSPKYYFKVAHFLSKWRDTNWKVSAIFIINRQFDFLKSFEKILLECYGKGCYRKNFNLKNKKLYEFSNFALTMQYNLDESQDDEVSIELLFSNVNVTYKNSEKMLRELRILFDNIEKETKISDKNYNLNISFSSRKNPFYGLMIQRLGEEHVEYFECVFPLSLLLSKDMDGHSEEKCTLRVFKDYISINETDFNKVEYIAKKCLIMG